MGLVEERLSHCLKGLDRWAGELEPAESGHGHRITRAHFLIRLNKQLAIILEALLGSPQTARR